MRFALIIFCLLVIQSCDNRSVKVAENKIASAPIGSESLAEIPLDSIKGAYLNLDKKRYDFGNISRKKQPLVPIEFKIENIGKEPLIILKVDVSCGCLSVDYPKNPIKPGEKTIITVNVNTKTQEGMFNKSIFIKSNAENDVELIRIVGEVRK